MSTTGTTSTRAPSVPRTAIQFAMAATITAPAAVRALSGDGTPWSALLVFVVALSVIWIVSAIAMSVTAWREPTLADRRSESAAPARPDAQFARGSHPLARIPVAKVPAELAVHADEHGNLTAATNMGEMK
jgi:hypothetical protein